MPLKPGSSVRQALAWQGHASLLPMQAEPRRAAWCWSASFEHVVRGCWLGFLLHSECSQGELPEGQQGVGVRILILSAWRLAWRGFPQPSGL